MELGPRHISALLGIQDAEYTGIGSGCTFRGAGGPAIPWRLMAGLEDRYLVTIREKERMRGTGESVWVAAITERGIAALATRSERNEVKPEIGGAEAP